MKPEDLEYCRQTLIKADYYHYLISLFMALEKRRALWVVGAFRQVIETIPSSVSNPALGYMRLTWWRDQINTLEQGGLTKGQPILSAIKHYLHPRESMDPSIYKLLTDFIDDHEALIENPEASIVSVSYAKLLEKILGSDLLRYKKLEDDLTDIMKKYHGTKWENDPPFLALRLWIKNLIY